MQVLGHTGRGHNYSKLNSHEMSFKEFLKKKIEKSMTIKQKLDNSLLEGEITNIKIHLNVLPLEVVDERVFIVIGSVDRPAGISTTEANVVVLYTEDNRCVWHGTTDAVKDIIRRNYRSLEKDLDATLAHIGVYVPRRKFLDYATD